MAQPIVVCILICGTAHCGVDVINVVCMRVAFWLTHSGVSLYYMYMINIEQELKLALDERQYNNIVADALSCSEHTNHYFYCDHMPSGLTVRIRHSDSGYVLTVKVHVSHTNDVNVCQEHNAELTEGLAISMIECGITAEQLQHIVGIEVPYNLRSIGYMTNLRSIVDIDGHIVEVDRCSYLDTVDYELEYECNDRAKMQRLRSVLIHRYALSLTASVSKYHRFCEVLSKIPMMI